MKYKGKYGQMPVSTVDATDECQPPKHRSRPRNRSWSPGSSFGTVLFIANFRAMTCKNCGHRFEGNFCSSCGQSAQTPRFDGRHLLQTALESVDLDRGFLRAIKLLLTSPGTSLRRYIEGCRVNFVNPIKLFLLFGAVGTLLQFKLGLYGDIVGEPVMQFENAERFSFYSAKYSTLFSVVALPTFALVSWLAYRSSKLNYIENLILNVYVAAGQFLIWVLLVPLLYYGESWLIAYLYGAINVAYNVWVLSTFFRNGGLAGVGRAFAVVMISYCAMLLINYTLFGLTPLRFWDFLDQLLG